MQELINSIEDQFYLDSLTQEDLDIIPEKILKNGNTLVIKTKSKTEYQLRWKNGAGVLFPAWQVKLYYL
jgi:hypothetical protein